MNARFKRGDDGPHAIVIGDQWVGVAVPVVEWAHQTHRVEVAWGFVGKFNRTQAIPFGFSGIFYGLCR
jgi:hypothetical protein